MSIDRSYIRVKAMLIALNHDGSAHLVSVAAASQENPNGFHRLVGGGVELGETHHDAIIREVDEELGARIDGLQYVGMLENIFRYNGELGHEIVAVYKGRLVPEPSSDGGTLTESDGSIVPVTWRPVDDSAEEAPLYPAGIEKWLQTMVHGDV